MKIKGIDKWILPAYYPQAGDYDTRINVYYGGAGSGKSHFVIQKMALKSLQMYRKVLVIRKVQSTVKDSVWALAKEIFADIPNSIKKLNKSDLEMTLSNDSVWIFKGLDDPEKIKSITGITDIIIEEATELTLDDYTQLNLRLRSKKPYNQIHLMFNPVSKANWCYQYFFKGNPPENCKVYQTTYKDNPHLPDAYIKSLLELASKNPAYYKIYALGEFATLDKLVFPCITKAILNVEEIKERGAYFWCGMDFGYENDPTAITWGYYDPARQDLYITGEYTKKGMTNDVIAKTIINLGLSKERVVADSAEPKSIAEIKKMGIKRLKAAVKGPDSIINGIDQMGRCNIYVDERCVDTIEEFENYTWKKDRKTNEYINTPVDTFNHHIDSIRYGIQTVIKKKKKSDKYIPLWNGDVEYGEETYSTLWN